MDGWVIFNNLITDTHWLLLLRPQAGPQHTRNHKPYIGQDSDIIEISSDSEPNSETEELKEMKQKFQSFSKKRTLSASTNDPPCKRQLTGAAAEVIELLDSDSESDNNIIIDIPTIKAETLPSMIPISSSFKKISPIPEEQIKQSKSTAAVTTTPLGFKLRIDESAKDSEGRYIVTKKVKVDSVEVLSEVPKRWPIPREDTTIAYVINLSEDKRWQDGTSKEKAFDRFLKQEVMSLYSVFLPGPFFN